MYPRGKNLSVISLVTPLTSAYRCAFNSMTFYNNFLSFCLFCALYAPHSAAAFHGSPCMFVSTCELFHVLVLLSLYYESKIKKFIHQQE